MLYFQGDKGDKGDTGAKGIKGHTGHKGDQVRKISVTLTQRLWWESASAVKYIMVFFLSFLGTFGTNGTKGKSGKNSYKLRIFFKCICEWSFTANSTVTHHVTYMNRGTQDYKEIPGWRVTRFVEPSFVWELISVENATTCLSVDWKEVNWSLYVAGSAWCSWNQRRGIKNLLSVLEPVLLFLNCCIRFFSHRNR